MARLTSQLVITLVDKVSGPARGIAASLKQFHAEARAQPFQTMAREGARARQSLVGFAGAATTAGMGLYGFMSATREFNEAKFGYGFARITDFIKDGKLDTAAWKAEMDLAANASRNMAKQVGSTADVTMKAREATEKLGLKGNVSESIWQAALGLRASEQDEMAADQAASYIGAIYRAYEKNRKELAAKMGKDADDPGFVDAWIKGIAGKTAIAGAESALGPADIVEGLRQYAPQWAQMGMSPEYAMAMLAHGSNYGFRAPELGTAFKSMASRLVKPTAGGVRALNALGIDRTKYMGGGAADPAKAVNTLNSLLGGTLFRGKGGSKVRDNLVRVLMKAQKEGRIGDPNFQEGLTNAIAKRLGRRTEQDIQEIQMAVANATQTSDGSVNVDGLIRELIQKKAGPAALMEIFEGKHFARNTPVFAFYEKMYSLYEKLNAIDGSVIDAIITGRKETEAGTADQLAGAWKELLLTMQDTGVIEGAKNALIGIANALRAMPPDVVKIGTGLIVLGGALTALGFAAGGAVAAVRMLYAGALGLAGLVGIGGRAAVATAAGGSLFSLGAGGVAGGAAAKIASQRMLLGMGAGTQASGRMIAGMGAAGAAAGVGTKVGRGLLARAGAMIVPGLGLVMLAGSGAAGAYAAYKDYQKTGSVASAAKAFGWGFLTMGMGGTANASEAPGGGMPSIGPRANADGSWQNPQQIAVDMQSSMDRVRGIVAGVDLTAEGARIIQTLAAGMRSAIPAVQSAASSAAAAAASSALRGAYSDGAR